MRVASAPCTGNMGRRSFVLGQCRSDEACPDRDYVQVDGVHVMLAAPPWSPTDTKSPTDLPQTPHPPQSFGITSGSRPLSSHPWAISHATSNRQRSRPWPRLLHNPCLPCRHRQHNGPLPSSDSLSCRLWQIFTFHSACHLSVCVAQRTFTSTTPIILVIRFLSHPSVMRPTTEHGR